MLDPANYGYLLEDILLQELKSVRVFDDVLHEKCLKRLWGWCAAGVDHFIIIGDYAIPIQTKWRNTRRRENIFVDKFLHSLDYTISRSGKKLLFGLWVSKLEPFTDNMERLAEKNVICISCFDSIEVLVQKALSVILEKINATALKTI
jgi:hypothetical protein